MSKNSFNIGSFSLTQRFHEEGKRQNINLQRRQEISKNLNESNTFVSVLKFGRIETSRLAMTSKNTHWSPDTHKHPAAASRESSCSHSVRQPRRADYSPNYTPSPNYPIIKPLAVSHHINWVPPLRQFVQSQSATGSLFFWGGFLHFLASTIPLLE